MKKLLVIAFMSLFAVSAFAVSMDFTGSTEFYGYLISNRNADNDAKTAAFYDQNFYLYGKAMMDPDAKASLNFRFKLDQIFGNNNSTFASFDRVWLEYQFVDCVKLTLGRTNALRTKSAWGRSFYNSNATTGNGSVDLIKAVYTVNDNVAIRAQMEKIRENEIISATNPTPNNLDADLYLVAGDMKFDDLGIYPVVTFLNDQQADGFKIGAHVGVDYVPASGLNVQAVVAASMLSGADNSALEYTVFGAMADFSYVADKYKAGLIFAYASDDEDAGVAFSFGKDWDKTKIVDAGVSWNWNYAGATPSVTQTPASGVMAFYLYGDYKMTDDLTLGAVGALYMAAGDIYTFGFLGSNGTWTDDPMVIEVDLKAKYNFTRNTFASAGAAVAFVTEDLAANNESMDPVMVFWWGLQTNF